MMQWWSFSDYLMSSSFWILSVLMSVWMLIAAIPILLGKERFDNINDLPYMLPLFFLLEGGSMISELLNPVTFNLRQIESLRKFA